MVRNRPITLVRRRAPGGRVGRKVPTARRQVPMVPDGAALAVVVLMRVPKAEVLMVRPMVLAVPTVRLDEVPAGRTVLPVRPTSTVRVDRVAAKSAATTAWS